MNGTVMGTVNIYDGTKLIWQARSGDRVNIVNEKLTSLSRGGVVKFSGSYDINLSYVKMDVVVEPPPTDPEPPTPINDYIIHVVNDVEVARYYRANP